MGRVRRALAALPRGHRLEPRAKETVLVTDRDRVVAEITPPRAGRADVLADAQLADAVRRGWLTPPPLPATGVPPRRPVARLDELLGELAADRAER